MYQDHESKWKPSHLFILLRIKGREAAGFAEAGLIDSCRALNVDMKLNINIRNKDLGGTGPRQDPEATRILYVAALPTSND